MSNEYKDEIKKMGADVERVVEKVLELEMLFKTFDARLQDIELRNKQLEVSC